MKVWTLDWYSLLFLSQSLWLCLTSRFHLCEIFWPQIKGLTPNSLYSPTLWTLAPRGQGLSHISTHTPSHTLCLKHWWNDQTSKREKKTKNKTFCRRLFLNIVQEKKWFKQAFWQDYIFNSLNQPLQLWPYIYIALSWQLKSHFACLINKPDPSGLKDFARPVTFNYAWKRTALNI